MMNRATLIGNVGRDPEIRSTNSGSRVANFSLATSEKWTVKGTGEKKERTEWHRITVFSEGLVDLIEKYVKKGMRLFIEGQIQTRKWTDQQGNEKFATEIVLNGMSSKLQMLDRVGGGGAPPPADSAEDYGSTRTSAGGTGTASGRRDDLDDEIPF